MSARLFSSESPSTASSTGRSERSSGASERGKSANARGRARRSPSTSMRRLGRDRRAAEALDRAPQPLVEADLRLQAEDLAGSGDVGLAHLGIVDRQPLEDDLRARAGQRDDLL